MVSDLFFYQLVLIALVWLCLMLQWVWPSDRRTVPDATAHPRPRHKRHREPTPFAGLTTKPHCDACEHSTCPSPTAAFSSTTAASSSRGGAAVRSTPPRIFAPTRLCAIAAGWAGATSAPMAIPMGAAGANCCASSVAATFWRPSARSFTASVSDELIVRVIACLAGGLGIRGTARVFEVDPNTVLQWLVEAAEQLRAFSSYFLHDLHVQQVQLDELYAVLSAVKDGTISEAEAIERLERSPQWVWVAMDPESKLLLAIDVGDRTLAMAQRFVHHVAQVLAPDCAPLFLTDGFREYMTALLTHYGQWVQPPRRQAQGPAPKPRWMPLPQLLYAQVVKTVRRRRLVDVSAPCGVRHAGGR